MEFGSLPDHFRDQYAREASLCCIAPVAENGDTAFGRMTLVCRSKFRADEHVDNLIACFSRLDIMTYRPNHSTASNIERTIRREALDDPGRHMSQKSDFTIVVDRWTLPIVMMT